MFKRAVQFVSDNSILLILGAGAGLLWANLAPTSYAWLSDLNLAAIPKAFEPDFAWHGVSLHYLVNDVLMAFFFALAGKEVWEALLPGGALRDGRRAATPILCAIGGMIGPATIYLVMVALSGQWTGLQQGWAIPCATDIAFSYLIARWVFGKTHPAVPFLLLLAIVDDALGLVVLAVFYPVHAIHPLWLLLSALGVGTGLLMRRSGIQSFWWYLAGPGALSWLGFALSGIHPALGLLPIIPTMPHARVPAKTSHWEISHQAGTLDHFEAFWKRPVEGILGLFGLLNAGVTLAVASGPTWFILVALLAGKPFGICLTGLFCTRLLRLHLPAGIRLREILVIGCAAGIGFTVALFVATVAFPKGAVQDAAKMGALASFLAAGTTLLAARVLRAGIPSTHAEGR
jgi:NhaA family Na+:H+ antiporter